MRELFTVLITVFAVHTVNLILMQTTSCDDRYWPFLCLLAFVPVWPFAFLIHQYKQYKRRKRRNDSF